MGKLLNYMLTGAFVALVLFSFLFIQLMLSPLFWLVFASYVLWQAFKEKKQ
jgi:hypothetical protein